MTRRKVIFCLGVGALPVAKKIATELEAELHGKADRVSQEGLKSEADVFFNDAMEHLSNLFRDGVAIIGVCASAVLIRGVANCLKNKLNEPPLIAVAEDGSAVVPLLGGHHGANDLARKIADFLEITPAITTAGDLRFGIALDEPPEGFVLANPENVKEFTASLLEGGSVAISSENSAVAPDCMPGFYRWLQESKLPFLENAKLRISLASKQISGSTEHLVFHPQNYAVGVGCERGTEPEELISLVRNTLQENLIAPESVALVVSLDLKADEPAVHAAAERLNCPARFFDADSLEAQTSRIQNPSEIVFQEVGCHGVAEGSALAATGDSGILRVPKVKSNGSSGVGRATCAIAKAPECLNPETIGRPQGTLFIVGTGPGSPQWRLPESEKMLRKATDWVGYGLYLDLISDLHNGQKLHPFNLGQEEVRARHALNLAALGKTVALVSSGDPGIYAMSTLIFELLERGEQEGSDPLEWQRVRVEAAPGISALQAANARIGAPMGHDFCTISLSDLLTPWETIERRIKTAAEGDFVIAFYNPVSRRRTTQLAQAREILLQYRPPGTSVILGRNLGRVEEKVQVITLENLDPTQVDMFTVALVGSSQTRRLQLLNGEVKVYTPRGYANKQ